METRIIDKESEIIKLGIQILLITANEIEKKALDRKMTPYTPNVIIIVIGRKSEYHIGYFGNYLVAHVHCEEKGVYKPDAAMLTVDEAYQLFKPKCAIMIGIAYGVNNEMQKIGDILISGILRPYSSVRQSTSLEGDSVVEDRNSSFVPGRIILNQFSRFPLYNKENRTHTGALLCGEEVIDNVKYRDKLVEIQNKYIKNHSKLFIVGGEMEGVGLACVFKNQDNSTWIVIKAICDFADGEKNVYKECRQKLAAKNAVDFCFHVFKTELLSRNIPHFEKKDKNYNDKLNDTTINAFYLFAARNNESIGLAQLAKKIRINETELRHFEKIKNVDAPDFHKTTYSKMERIRKTLKIGHELMGDETEEAVKLFFQNKGADFLCPAKDAKAVVFDFDGTLTKKKDNISTWHMIWKQLGGNDGLNKQKDLYNRYIMSEEFTYMDWCEKTADYFKEKRLDKETMLKITKKIVLINDIKETLEILYSNDIPIYICSGSIDFFIKHSLRKLSRYFKDISANKFFMEGNFFEAIGATKYDYEGKSDYIYEVIVPKEKIEPSDILFVGNSDNDEKVISSGAKTLLINPAHANCKKFKYNLGNINSLKQILPFILPSKYYLEKKIGRTR
jgi:HAD superfamily phosphoserine phosphatase-like hydrolase